MADFDASLVDVDVTDDTDLIARVVSSDIRKYLDLYFHGWRLLRRVNEHPSRSPQRRQPWKDVAYVIAVATERDAEILTRKLQTINYVLPCSNLRISDIVFKLPEAGKNWIKRMDAGGLHRIETTLNNVGEESFLKNWRRHKEYFGDSRK